MIDDRTLMVVGLIVAAVLLLVVAVVVLLRDAAASRLEQRVFAVVGDDARRQGAPALTTALDRLLRRVGEKIRGGTKLYSEQDLIGLENAITASGMNANRTLPLLLGAKVMLTILVPLAAIIYGLIAGLQRGPFLLLVCAVTPFGMMGPDWILGFLRRPYLAALRRGLPDALDLLVVCTEAGMGLEVALQHVSSEIASSNPAISVALSQLLDELRVLPDRREAFTNFGRRSGVDGIRRLATMLGQTLQYGTPLAEALRAVSSDLRRERMVALEAKCVKLPAMLVMPLLVFIMPALFIVLAGSPVLRVLDTLHNLGGPPHPVVTAVKK